MNRFRTLLLFILTAVFIAASGSANAQTINGTTYYYYAGAAGSFTGVGTPPPLIGINADDSVSAVTNIGFTFWFAGTPYTQFSVTEDGLMKLGSIVIVSEPVNNLASGLNLPKIAPYWDDLATGPAGRVVHWLGGTAPARFLVVQWDVILKNVVNTPAISFQVRLYENGNIFFKSGVAPVANSGGYTMGIASTTTDFASVSVTSATVNSVSYTAVNNSNTIGTARQIQFTTDNTAPTINGNNVLPVLPNQGTANRIFSTVIADQAGTPVSGIPITGGYVPRVYFKKNDGNWFFTAASLTAGNGTSGTWEFTIDHSLIGGVIPGDMISYYVVAQDNAYLTIGHANIKSSPTGAVGIDVTNITTPPATIPYYIISGSFSGTKTVGNGGDYASLTLAGGLFDQINAGELTGNLVINIISDLTAETGLKALNAWANGTGGPFTLTINPVGNRIISGANINGGNGSLITLNGATGVTIDGLNDGTNSLSFVQTGSYYAAVGVINLKGASNNTITRATIKGYGGSNSAILITTAATPSSNNIISYCNITTNEVYPSGNNAGYGICLVNHTTGTIVTGDHNVIDHNTITNFSRIGISTSNGTIYPGKYSNTVISNNDIYNTVGTAYDNTFSGILISTAVVGTTNIFNNKIHDLLVQTNTASTGIPAILTTGPTGTTTNIYNNLIYLDASFTHPMQTWYGVQTSDAGAVNIYYNSIYIGGTNITATTFGNSYGLYRGGTGATNIRNNVVVFNARSNSTGIGKHYGIYTVSLTSLTSNYNDIYVNGTGGYFGFSTSDRLTLADWQTTGKDANSLSVDPQFTSSTNLKPLNGLLAAGTPIAGYTTDFNGVLRNATTPTMGAYEYIFVTANLKVFLEGPYNGAGGMTTSLNAIIPLSSNIAYPTATYNYTASTVVSIPNIDIVDWVLVELRTSTASGTKVATRAGFLKSNGTIVDVDGTSPLKFAGLGDGNYWVVVRHRNHLAIMSAVAVPLSGSSTLYDFSTLQSQAYGSNSMILLNTGIYGMIGGDGNTDGNIDYPIDVLNLWFPNFGLPGYMNSDNNMDGSVDYPNDILSIWFPNFGLITQVP